MTNEVSRKRKKKINPKECKSVATLSFAISLIYELRKRESKHTQSIVKAFHGTADAAKSEEKSIHADKVQKNKHNFHT